MMKRFYRKTYKDKVTCYKLWSFNTNPMSVSFSDTKRMKLGKDVVVLLFHPVG